VSVPGEVVTHVKVRQPVECRTWAIVEHGVRNMQGMLGQ
jgi:hypothetical protein